MGFLQQPSLYCNPKLHCTTEIQARNVVVLRVGFKCENPWCNREEVEVKYDHTVPPGSNNISLNAFLECRTSRRSNAVALEVEVESSFPIDLRVIVHRLGELPICRVKYYLHQLDLPLVLFFFFFQEIIGSL